MFLTDMLIALIVHAAALPLRPLVYTAGAAAAAVCLYWYFTRGDGGSAGRRTRGRSEDTEVPVPPLVQPTEDPLDQDKVEADKSNLNVTDETKPGVLLCKLIQMKTEQTKCQHKALWQAFNVLVKEEINMMNKLLKHKEELLKLSLAEAKETHQKSVEIIHQLEVEKSNLKHQVETQQAKVQDLEKLLSQAEKERDEVKIIIGSVNAENSKLALHVKTLQQTLEHIRFTLSKTQSKCDKLKVSLADVEEKYLKAVEITGQLEAEKSDLELQLKTQQQSVQNQENHLSESQSVLLEEYNVLKMTNASLQARNFQMETHVQILQSILGNIDDALNQSLMKCDRLQKECEQHQVDQIKFQEEIQELKESLTHSEELLKVSLADTEEKYLKAVEIIGQLEAEKSDLKLHPETQQQSVQDQENLQSESHSVLLKEYNVLKMTNASLQAENSQLVTHVQILQRTLDKYKDAVCETLMQCENVQKVSLADIEEQYQKAVEITGQLETEKSDLKLQLKTEQQSVQNQENLQSESHSVLLEEYNVLKMTNASLQSENSQLVTQVQILQSILDNIDDALYDTHMQCEKVQKECEQHQVDQNKFHEEIQELKETLTHSEELLKVSLADIEKYLKAVEIIGQLEAENSELILQLKTKQPSGQNQENLQSAG